MEHRWNAVATPLDESRPLRNALCIVRWIFAQARWIHDGCHVSANDGSAMEVGGYFTPAQFGRRVCPWQVQHHANSCNRPSVAKGTSRASKLPTPSASPASSGSATSNAGECCARYAVRCARPSIRGLRSLPSRPSWPCARLAAPHQTHGATPSCSPCSVTPSGAERHARSWIWFWKPKSASSVPSMSTHSGSAAILPRDPRAPRKP